MRITGIRDIDKEILLKVERDEDFLRCMTLNSYIYSLYDEYLFSRRMKRKYPDVKNKDSTSYKKLYLKTVSKITQLKKVHNFDFRSGDPEKYLDIFSHPSATRYQSYVIGKYNYEDVFYMIGKYNYEHVFYMLYPQDITYFLNGAASGGQLKLVKELISSNNFNLNSDDYNTALCSAIKRNRREIIDLFLSLGANDYREFLIETVKYNNQDLIDLFRSFL